MYSKGIKTETVFTKTEMNNEWNINSLQKTYFSKVFHWLKHLWIASFYSVKLCYLIYSIFHILKLDKFSV